VTAAGPGAPDPGFAAHGGVAGAVGSGGPDPGPVAWGGAATAVAPVRPPLPPPRPLFGDRWPAPVGPASDEVLASVSAVGVVVAVAVPNGPTGVGVKRGMLAALAVLTLVVVASAISRMWLHQQAYGFTVLRVLVLTCELWLGAGFLIALVAVLRLRLGGLSRPMVAAGVLALLALAVVDPERFIAEENIARWTQSGRLDTGYLATLSADAVPALVRLPEPVRSCVLADIADGLARPDDWRAANASRTTSRGLLAGLDLACGSR
jgi:Domain of unknown function (DUF4153)